MFFILIFKSFKILKTLTLSLHGFRVLGSFRGNVRLIPDNFSLIFQFFLLFPKIEFRRDILLRDKLTDNKISLRKPAALDGKYTLATLWEHLPLTRCSQVFRSRRNRARWSIPLWPFAYLVTDNSFSVACLPKNEKKIIV